MTPAIDSVLSKEKMTLLLNQLDEHRFRSRD